MAYRHIPHYRFAIVIRHADGCSSSEVILESSRKIAIARAMRGLVGAKVEFCKTEDELSNDETGRWDMPSYRAPAQQPTDYSRLDLY